MTHYKQFRDAFIRNGAKDNGCSIVEYTDAMEEQTCLDAWMLGTTRFLSMGAMSTAWWNSVMANRGTYGKLYRWMHDNPELARQWGHDMAWALAHVRRDARAAIAAGS